jgi:hypothetical protein
LHYTGIPLASRAYSFLHQLDTTFLLPKGVNNAYTGIRLASKAYGSKKNKIKAYGSTIEKVDGKSNKLFFFFFFFLINKISILARGNHSSHTVPLQQLRNTFKQDFFFHNFATQSQKSSTNWGINITWELRSHRRQ